MVTNFAEMSPQQRGVLVTNTQANRFPDGSTEQQELLAIRNAGLDALNMMNEVNGTNPFPPQGRLNSRFSKLSPQEHAKRVAQQMLEAGKTPQEIGAIVAAILGFDFN